MSEKMPWQMTRTEWEHEIEKANQDWQAALESKRWVEANERLRFLRGGIRDRIVKGVRVPATYDEVLRLHNMVAE